MSLIAKIIVKNKFWIVEKNGKQIATIQVCPDGITFVKDEEREKFVSIKLLKSKYNITFASDKKKKKRTSDVSYEVNGFSCNHKPYNALINIAKKIPVFTKTNESKSFFCAGHYLIKFNQDFVYSYCPKFITLSRYEFYGPFKTKTSAKDFAKLVKDIA